METEFLNLGLDIIGLGVFNYQFGSITTESPVIKAVYGVLKGAMTERTPAGLFLLNHPALIVQAAAGCCADIQHGAWYVVQTLCMDPTSDVKKLFVMWWLQQRLNTDQPSTSHTGMSPCFGQLYLAKYSLQRTWQSLMTAWMASSPLHEQQLSTWMRRTYRIVTIAR